MVKLKLLVGINKNIIKYNFVRELGKKDLFEIWSQGSKVIRQNRKCYAM